MRDIQDRRRVSQEPASVWRPPGLSDGHPLGNLIYLGKGLSSVNGLDTEPALIDTRLAIDKKVTSCSPCDQDWEPSYTHCSMQLRAGYQVWLKTGRRDPDAQIGHVFLYFYGLERRAVHDVRTEPAARAERPAIRAELERLLSIYGKHGRFQERASALVDFLAAQDQPPRSYLQEPEAQDGELTLTEQVSLAQCADDAAPLPAAWALRWAATLLRERLAATPNGFEAPPPQRLAAFFDQLYRRYCGTGLLLPQSPRRLQLKYWPASPTFDGTLKWVTVDTTLPAVVEPREGPGELRTIVAEMAAYLANHGGQVPELLVRPGPTYLSGPVEGWPESARKLVENFRPTFAKAQSFAHMYLRDFAQCFFQRDSLDLDQYRDVCEALGREGIGVHPDLRFCERLSGGVILFMQDPAAMAEEPSARWRSVALLLDLAGVVVRQNTSSQEARAKGILDGLEQDVLPRLTPSEQDRAAAHLLLARRFPTTLASLSQTAQGFETHERLWIGKCLVALLRRSGRILRHGKAGSALQECLEALDLDTDALLGNGVSYGEGSGAHKARGYRIPPPALQDSIDTGPVMLDAQKIAALHQEEERIATLLEPIFADTLSTPLAHPLGAPAGPDAVQRPSVKSHLLGLDAGACEFLRVLLGKASWSRAELARLARERGLPLDGMLERLNEAAYNALDMPLFEDGDPVVLNPDAVAAKVFNQVFK